VESDKPLPPFEVKVKDEYGFILQNILKTFIEQKYLKLQLSQRKFEQKTLELLALQSQMNPHFLFNTLETINWRIVALNGLDCDASVMLQNLSDVLKYSLGSSDEYVTLFEEIVNTNSYIQILKARYHDKFNVKWQYDRELEHLKVIKLLIQPLIENSVYHGIKEKPGKSSIKIKIRMPRFDRLTITVIDNGTGMQKSRLDSIRSDLEAHKRSDTHIGLFNTNRRLILAYGEEFPLTIKSKAGLGTVVHIEIPIT
jgi:two-component system sensor histidine kinase YesM